MLKILSLVSYLLACFLMSSNSNEITNNTTNSNNDTVLILSLVTTKDDVMRELNRKWMNKLDETRLKVRKRSQMVFDTLKYGAGIYVNESKAIALNLTKTVYITLYNNENGDEKYIQLLKNQLCYGAQYGFKPIIYVLNTHDNTTISDLYNDLKEINPAVRLLSYPLHIFYRFLVRKKAIKEAKFGIVDFLGDNPSFKRFGAVTMIVPMMEVLQAGYNFVFFDADVTFIADPFPYMTKGSADIIVSQETRMCQKYTSLHTELTDWSSTEPNTGAIFVKSSVKTLNLYSSWINTLMAEQPSNDQFFLMFKAFNAKYERDCLLGPYNNSAFTYAYEGNNVKNKSLTYCFYEEFLIQNGVIGCHCQNGFRRSNINTWPMLMSRYAMSATTSRPSLRDLKKKLTPINDRVFYHPLIMHVNYVGDKIKCARDKGAFIYEIDKNMCSFFDIEHSHWAKMDWRSIIWDATENLNYSDVSWLNSFLVKSVDKLTFLNKTIDTIGYTQGYSVKEIDMITDYIVSNKNRQIVPFIF